MQYGSSSEGRRHIGRECRWHPCVRQAHVPITGKLWSNIRHEPLLRHDAFVMHVLQESDPSAFGRVDEGVVLAARIPSATPVARTDAAFSSARKPTVLPGMEKAPGHAQGTGAVQDQRLARGPVDARCLPNGAAFFPAAFCVSSDGGAQDACLALRAQDVHGLARVSRRTIPGTFHSLSGTLFTGVGESENAPVGVIAADARALLRTPRVVFPTACETSATVVAPSRSATTGPAV
mmetsp:Transcript_85591/g.238989  ORF Transcript_85591/g.238989 Transcript_85591/m.238989 type:complete len:235 (-) Transcript_85591:409-1113(-)